MLPWLAALQAPRGCILHIRNNLCYKAYLGPPAVFAAETAYDALNGNPMSPEMRLRLGWAAVIVLFCAAAALLYLDYGRWTKGAGVRYGIAAIGAPAPDVLLDTLDGAHARLASFQGAPLVVNFFATWCVPCKAELPLLQSRYVQLRSRGLRVLGVDQQEDASQVRAFVKAHGVTYPVVIDGGAAIDAYGGHAIPMSLFIDAHGVLRAVHIGEMSADMLDDDLQKIM
jgi:cytochrome c biogenesis protein CcmG/thiol:disulfide interchange protein DsbE